MIVSNGASKVTIEATITRADGSVETLGTVARWDRSPFKRLFWGVKQWLRKFKI
jgi:hypothetical protein